MAAGSSTSSSSSPSSPFPGSSAGDPIGKQKEKIRAEMRAYLERLTPAEVQAMSEAVCAQVLRTETFHHANTILLYMPVGTEVDISRVALRSFQDGKTVCLPKVDWDHRRMWPVAVQNFNESALPLDRHGIRSPEFGAPVPVEMLDLVIAPGLAFDTDGGRIGRGGGYFDRFLGQSAFAGQTIGVCFDRQILEHVPMASHDVLMDVVVTDRRCICISKAIKGP